MVFYSGRIDMLEEEEDMLDIFHDFVEHFEIDGCLFTFEDKTKSGLSTKPHYHFLIETDYKHDTLRKYITKLGFPKNYASLRVTEPDAPCYNYILKQGTVVYTDYDEELIAKLIDESANYQESVAPKINKFKDHMENLLLNQDPDLIYVPTTQFHDDMIDKNKEFIKVEGKFKLHKMPFPNEREIFVIEDIILDYIDEHLLEIRCIPARHMLIYYIIQFSRILCPEHVKKLLRTHYNLNLFY